MLPLWAIVNLGAMTMKGCSVFPKAPASLEHHHQIVYCYIRTLVGGGSYLSAEVKSVYSIAPADLAIQGWNLAIRWFSVIFRILVVGLWGSYPSAEMPLVYSIIPADGAYNLEDKNVTAL